MGRWAYQAAPLRAVSRLRRRCSDALHDGEPMMARNDDDPDRAHPMAFLSDLPEPFGMTLIGNFESPAWTNLETVSTSLLDGYARLVTTGLRPDAVGLAMLGATVNLYEMFDMSDALPSALRIMAERIELRDRVN